MYLKPELIIFLAPYIIAAILAIFVLWYESKRDGFDSERIFDVFVSMALALFPLIYFYNWLYKALSIYWYSSPIIKLDVFYLILLSEIILGYFLIKRVSKTKNWSFYRLIDIYSLSLFVPLVVYLINIIFLNNVLISNRAIWAFVGLFIYLIIFKVLSLARKIYFPSGYIFVIACFTLLLLNEVAIRKKGHLIFSLFIVTISVAAVYFRRKRGIMISPNLPKDFLSFIKGKLLKKEKELVKEQKLLKKEDPYLQPGRAQENSEYMDEAILEDVSKQLHDNKTDFITAMRAQINRALFFIKMGRYGICEICGKPIDKARLAIYPQATKCLDCASKSEKRS